MSRSWSRLRVFAAVVAAALAAAVAPSAAQQADTAIVQGVVVDQSNASIPGVTKPSVAIPEFKVVTNGYAAEYGRSSSGVVSVSLKSGTNQVTGSVFDFFRDSALDSKNYVATEKAPFNRHQFGGRSACRLSRTARSCSATSRTASRVDRRPRCRRCRWRQTAADSSRGRLPAR